MRHALFIFALLVPFGTTAQPFSWISTNGPGFATPSSLIGDLQGRPLLTVHTSTLALSLDGETWESYASRPDILTVVTEEYYVTEANYLIPGAATTPRVSIWAESSYGTAVPRVTNSTGISARTASSNEHLPPPTATCGPDSRYTTNTRGLP